MPRLLVSDSRICFIVVECDVRIGLVLMKLCGYGDAGLWWQWVLQCMVTRSWRRLQLTWACETLSSSSSKLQVLWPRSKTLLLKYWCCSNRVVYGAQFLSHFCKIKRRFLHCVVVVLTNLVREELPAIVRMGRELLEVQSRAKMNLFPRSFPGVQALPAFDCKSTCCWYHNDV